MTNDIKKQLDFLNQNLGQSQYTINDLQEIVTQYNFKCFFINILNIEIFGLIEIERDVFVITTKNNNVICIGNKDEIDYLIDRVNYFVNPKRTDDFRTLGTLKYFYN